MTDPQHPSWTPDPEPSRYAGPPGYGSGHGEPSPAGQYQPGYGGVSAQPYGSADHPQGTTVLVLGILGIFLPVLAPVAWFLGGRALREVRSSGARPGNEQHLVIGRILGIVMTILLILSAVLGLLFFSLLAVVATGVQT